MPSLWAMSQNKILPRMERPIVVPVHFMGYLVARVKNEGTVLTDDTLLGINIKDPMFYFFLFIPHQQIKNYFIGTQKL